MRITRPTEASATLISHVFSLFILAAPMCSHVARPCGHTLLLQKKHLVAAAVIVPASLQRSGCPLAPPPSHPSAHGLGSFTEQPPAIILRTDVITHAIHLMPGSRPSYTPSYRVPHSRRVLFDEAVRGMLLQDVVELACSPHNAPLLLVPKKQGDWRVIVDF